MLIVPAIVLISVPPSTCSLPTALQESLIYMVWLLCTTIILTVRQQLTRLIFADLDCAPCACHPLGRGQRGTDRHVMRNGRHLEQGLLLGSGAFAEVTEMPKSLSIAFLRTNSTVVAPNTSSLPSPLLRRYITRVSTICSLFAQRKAHRKVPSEVQTMSKPSTRRTIGGKLSLWRTPSLAVPNSRF